MVFARGTYTTNTNGASANASMTGFPFPVSNAFVEQCAFVVYQSGVGSPVIGKMNENTITADFFNPDTGSAFTNVQMASSSFNFIAIYRTA